MFGGGNAVINQVVFDFKVKAKFIIQFDFECDSSVWCGECLFFLHCVINVHAQTVIETKKKLSTEMFDI